MLLFEKKEESKIKHNFATYAMYFPLAVNFCNFFVHKILK